MQDLKKYTKRKGAADECSVFYEHYISLLLFTRAKINKWKFGLAQNIDEAYDFDDVVISFQSKTFFLQLKHARNKKVITVSNLQNLAGDFSLWKYFKSYCQMKEHYSKKLSGLGKFEDFVFALYTNNSLHKAMKTCSCPLEDQWIKFLLTGGKAHSFNTGHFEKIIEFLDNRERYIELFQKSVSLLSLEEEATLLTFIQMFINNSAKELPNSDEELQKVRKKIMDLFETKEDGEVKQVANMTSRCFESFLKQLVFFSDQSSEKTTKKIILQELEQIYMKEISDGSHIDTMRRNFQELAKGDDYITDESDFWDNNVINPWIHGLCKEIVEELEPLLKITFSDEEYKQILVHRVQVNVADKGGAKFSLLKIHQRLKSEPHIMITWKKFCDHREEVLSLWERWCHILVLEMEASVNIKNIIQEMKNVLQDEKKRLVFVIEHKKPKYLKIRSIDSVKVRTINDTGCVWNSLSKESKEKVLDVKVVVQGTETTFGEAVGKEIHKWEHLLSPSFLLHLMTAKDPVHFGSKLKQPDIYIQRPLQRFQTLHNSVLQIPKAKFAVSGITEIEFHQNFSVGMMLRRFNMINSTEDFDNLVREFKDKNIHWLDYNGSGLVWKQSVGDMSDLVKHVDVQSSTPESCGHDEILSKQRMLLTAESGMGKSTFFSQMAAEIKRLKGGTIWIAKIKLEYHRHAFDYGANPNPLDLLLAARKGYYSNKSDKVFLEMMLKAGRVAVFFDGFSEVSHSDRVLGVLKHLLQHYPDIILWVASRPVTGGSLETLLQMLPYSLPYLELADEEKYLLHKWRQNNLNILVVKQFIEGILKNISISPRGVPLFLVIISETFQDELDEFVNNGKMLTLTDRVDNVFLLEKYIKKKLEIYCKTNRVNMNMKPIIEAYYMENHMLLSLKDVIDINKLEIASYLNIKLSSPDLESIHNMGIIHKSSSGRSSFLHRSFAEYFLALWFKTYHPSSINYLRDHIFKREFQPIRKFLDCLLAEGYTLHSDIIKGKKNIDLPNSKETINSKDIGGRTPLHLLVLECKDEEMSFGSAHSKSLSVLLAQKLLGGGADPNTTDNMLGWSCAQYALQAETWALLEVMLKYRAHDNCLNSIQDKLNNTSCRDTLLSAIAANGFIHLLPYVLKYIDVDTYVKHERTQKTMLHIAVEAKKFEVVKELVCAEADVNKHMKKSDYSNGTALHIAAEKGDFKIAQLLLECQALLNVTGAFGRDPIEQAAVFSKWRMVCYLSDRAKTVSYTPLVLAVKRGKLSVVRHLIRKTISPYQKSINLHQKNTLMHLAIVLGKLDIVKYLVSQGVMLNNRDALLMEASKFGMVGAVKYLIEKGAAVNTTDDSGHTPLYAALVNGRRKTASFLTRAGGTFSSRELHIEAFHEAVRLGNTKTLNIFLENIDVDERDKAGWTALHVAAWVGNNKVIRFLLNKRANINAVTEKPPSPAHTQYFNHHAPNLVGNTALHLAAARGKVTTLKLLIKRNADINRYNKDGEMALHTAACRGHHHLLNYLCTVYNVNNARTRKSDLVLHCAIRQKNLKVVRCLTDECDAELHAKGRNGSTPLCLAVEYNNVPLVLHLLYRGADINGTDGAGNTPLILSVRNASVDVMRILLKKGAAVDSQNKKGCTALHVAVGRLDFVSVWRLTNKGINIHLKDRKGRTALDVAEQRRSRKPDCAARRHKNTHGYGDGRCICVSGHAAYMTEHIINIIQRVMQRRR